jgi:hypothetical protein
MTFPPYLKARPEGVYLALKVQPRASQDEIGDPMGTELKVKVTAPPVDAAANEALIRLLAKKLACPRGALQIKRGLTSRHKLVFVRGLSAEQVVRGLE